MACHVGLLGFQGGLCGSSYAAKVLELVLLSPGTEPKSPGVAYVHLKHMFNNGLLGNL